MATHVRLQVRGIDPTYLDGVRVDRPDGHGNEFRVMPASGSGEPLRCCLRYARAGEEIALISYAPFARPSVWREIGPVYVHAQRCDGYSGDGKLPSQLASGPRVLRTYTADGEMNYDHNTVVTGEDDLEPIVARLLAEPDVALVHVRTLAPQCFLYAVTAA